jgi:hypothetical protein
VGVERTSPTSNITYMRTAMWSDNNFVCSSAYLVDLLSKCIRYPFPELCVSNTIGNRLKGSHYSYNWSTWGTWRYGGQGHPLQLLHLDGRLSAKCM